MKSYKIEEQTAAIQNLKQMLEDLTGEYEAYRYEKERKIESLSR